MLRVNDIPEHYKELIYAMKKVYESESFVYVPNNLVSFYSDVANYLSSSTSVLSSGFDFDFIKPKNVGLFLCSKGAESMYLKNTLDLSNITCEEFFCYPTNEQKEFGKHGIKMEHEEFSLIVLSMSLSYSFTVLGVEYENPKYILPFFKKDTFCSKKFMDIFNSHFSKYGYSIKYPMVLNRKTKIDAYRYLIEHDITFQPCDCGEPCGKCYKCAEYYWHYDALGYKCPINIDKDFLKQITEENRVLMENKNDKYDSFTTWNQLESLGYRKWYDLF